MFEIGWCLKTWTELALTFIYVIVSIYKKPGNSLFFRETADMMAKQLFLGGSFNRSSLVHGISWYVEWILPSILLPQAINCTVRPVFSHSFFTTVYFNIILCCYTCVSLRCRGFQQFLDIEHSCFKMFCSFDVVVIILIWLLNCVDFVRINYLRKWLLPQSMCWKPAIFQISKRRAVSHASV